MCNIYHQIDFSSKKHHTKLLPSQIIPYFEQSRSQIQVRCLQNSSKFACFSLKFQSQNLMLHLLLTLVPSCMQQILQQRGLYLNLKVLQSFFSSESGQILKKLTKFQLLSLVNSINIENLGSYQICVQTNQSQQNMIFVKKCLAIINKKKINEYIKCATSIYKMFFVKLKNFQNLRKQYVKDVCHQLKKIRLNFGKYNPSQIKINDVQIFTSILSCSRKLQNVQPQEGSQGQFVIKIQQEMQQAPTRILRSIQFKQKFTTKEEVHTSSYSILSKIKAWFRNFDTIIFFRSNYREEGGTQILQTYQGTGRYIQSVFAMKQIIHDIDQKKRQVSAQASLKNQKTFLMNIQAETNLHIGKFYFDVQEEQNFINNGKAKIYLDWEQSDLEQFLQRSEQLSFDNYLNFAMQILRGLHFIEQMGYIHRDLKLANIVISKNMILRLIDFGSVYPIYIENPDDYYKVKCSKFDSTPRLTPGYSVAYKQISKMQYPEIVKKYNSKSYNRNKLFDMYSFGIILKMFILKMKKQFNYLDSQIQQNLYFIIKTSLQVDPEKRLDPNQIMLIIEYIQEYLILRQKALKDASEHKIHE